MIKNGQKIDDKRKKEKVTGKSAKRYFELVIVTMTD